MTTSADLEQRTDADYVKILQDEFGWEVQGPSYAMVPQVRKEYLSIMGEWAERAEQLVESLRTSLLKTYFIQDLFDSDHGARRDFFRELLKEQPGLTKWIDEHSKLRLNNLRAIFDIMDIVRDLIASTAKVNYPQLPENLGEIKWSQLQEKFGGYNEMSFSEKVAYARQVDEAAYCFLEVLAK